ncbi:MAG: hypothetical protein COA70_03920 [Planctomycetota bacterium]|nr:MAG: hypothetical protein COA70_03920 [Planctomycetota bacterium]
MFIPIAIYNNTKGDADAAVLARYDEPAWNYQVLRVVNANGANLIPRVAKDWTTAAFAGAMMDGLTAAKLKVPTWLALIGAEELAKKRGVETAIFGMA